MAIANNNEIERITKSYEKRIDQSFYHPLDPYVVMSEQEKERALIKMLRWIGPENLNDKKILEIGCGKGLNLLLLIKLGFNPENLFGNELIDERIKGAKEILPSTVKFIHGNALDIQLKEKFDVIIQSTVFTSILDNEFKLKLAQKMWSLLKPSGAIIWYDFIYNNPRNKDVRGIRFKEIENLFSNGKIKKMKITLAPPLGRKIIKIHESLYTIFNLFPILRTHLLCWIQRND